jgi:hypothetical protein
MGRDDVTVFGTINSIKHVGCQRFRGTYHPLDGGGTFLRNAGITYKIIGSHNPEDYNIFTVVRTSNLTRISSNFPFALILFLVILSLGL